MAATDPEAPVYIPSFNDVFHIGTFLHVELPNQDDGTTTVCRLFKTWEGQVQLRVYLPLFPKKKLKCHPDIPPNSASRIIEGIGSENVELYKSNRRIVADNLLTKNIKIWFPAFVFSLKDPANSWAHGLMNVYFVQYEQPARCDEDPTPSLQEMSLMDFHCFPMDHLPKEFLSSFACTPRCFHRNVWTGLYLLRKGLMKILNRRGHQLETYDQQSLNLGSLPMETFNYLYKLANSNVKCLSSDQQITSETYQDTEWNLTRKKVKMMLSTTTLRFQTRQDIDILRRFLGLSAVYGSCEARPTLKHGEDGLTLKRGHFVTFINGSGEREEPPFKKRTQRQRIDMTFGALQCKVVVSFQRYRYDVARDGSLRTPPDSQHLTCLLQARPYKRDNFTGVMPPRPLIKDAESVVMESSDSEEECRNDEAPPKVTPPKEIVHGSPSLTPMSKNHSFYASNQPVDDSLISLGDQFYLEGSVYQVVTKIPANDRILSVLRDKEDYTLFHSPQGCDEHIEQLELVGTLEISTEIWYVSIVIDGDLFDSNKHSHNQVYHYCNDAQKLSQMIADFA